MDISSSVYHKPMNLPALQEMKIKDFNTERLVELFKQCKVGTKPFYIEIGLKQEKYIEPALDNIVNALEILEIDPRFPYPLYIITAHIKSFLDLPILSSKEEIPKYFSIKEHRLNNKEQLLLKKIQLLSKKIENNKVTGVTELFCEERKSRRELINLCMENESLQEILDQLNELES